MSNTISCVYAIDPGPVKSACVIWDIKDNEIVQCDILPNAEILELIYELRGLLREDELFAIEMIASYGMPVGAEVFETCVWIGRFIEAVGQPVELVKRLNIKVHHCGSTKAKDSNIRQALIDKYGAPGTKKAPGVTYGLKADMWAAFALATYVSDMAKLKGLAA